MSTMYIETNLASSIHKKKPRYKRYLLISWFLRNFLLPIPYKKVISNRQQERVREGERKRELGRFRKNLRGPERARWS